MVFFSSRRRHTRYWRDWSSDVCSSDLVERVHVELGQPDEEPRPGEGGLVLLVVPDDVAGVLAEPALDALAELLRPVDVDLLHPVVAVGVPGPQIGRAHV